MKRTFKFMALVALVIFGAAAPALAAMPGEVYDFTFDVQPWVAGSGWPKEITAKTLTHKTEFGPVAGCPNGYAALLDTNFSPVWMMAKFSNPGSYVEITFDARNVTGCEGCELIAYVGNKVPQYADRFRLVGEPLTDNWSRYSMITDVAGDVVVAIGYTNLDNGAKRTTVVQNIKEIVGIDNIRFDSYGPPDAN